MRKVPIAATKRTGPQSRFRSAARSDSGVTLIEVVVSMSLMAIFMAIATGAIVSIYGLTNRTEEVLDTSLQIHNAMSRLDTSVRYADAISDPFEDSEGNPSVLFSAEQDGTRTCTQLRLDGDSAQLQQRLWHKPVGPESNDATWSAPGPWTTLASPVEPLDVIDGHATPFDVSLFGDDPLIDRQQLAIRIGALGKSADGAPVSVADMTFVAFNSGGGSDMEPCQAVNGL